MPHSCLILPYVMEDSSRKTRFSENMEVAALLCIAEAERKKKSGIFRGSAETLAFASKLHFPFWLFPWEDNCLLIDGMETVSDSILYFKPPDVEGFVEHLKRSTTVHEVYHNALKSHRETFADFPSQTELSYEGFVQDRELLSDVLAFIKDGQGKTGVVQGSLIQPKIDVEKAADVGRRVLEHYRRLLSEMKGLQFAIDTVNGETEAHVGKLKLELEQLREDYEERISGVQVEVEKRVGDLERERDDKIEKVTVAHEKEVDARLAEKKKWELELLKLEQDKSEYEKRKELRKRKSDEIGEARWDARLKEVQNQISTVKGKTKALSDFISRTNKETEKSTKKLRDASQKLIDEEKKKITDLESLRDSEVKKKEGEIEELQRETLAITDKIEHLIDQKKERATIFQESAIPWKAEAPVLVSVPFYLIQYTAEKEKRYLVRPPVIAREHGGLVMKIRKTLKSYSLQSKIGTLLKSRSKALDKLFSSFEGKVQSDKGIEKNVSQLGVANNLLASADFRDKLKKGMEELEAEGWIKTEEKTAILKEYIPE